MTLTNKIARNTKSLIFFIAAIVLLIGLNSAYIPKSNALSPSQFNPGNIIDTSIFTNENSMSVTDIANFLNAKVGTCDTNGTQPSTHYDSATGTYYTHAQWGALNGDPAPFTCINEYVENTSTLQNNYSNPAASVSGGISAAQIIYDAAQAYDINPQVILTTLQKEQGLVTDNWPWYNEYQYAMGYSCPDSSGCSSTYADFYKQVDGAAWQFRQYLNNPSHYNYTVGNNYILYNPNTSCGGSVVDIQNQATAALYIYTPYQPNAAALTSLTGTGDSCSAYGNRNFWYYFNTWFGESNVDVYPWSIEEAIGGDGRYWLVVGNTKRWIPNGTILDDWNLQSYPIQQVAESEIDEIPTLPNLGNLGVTDTGQYVFVDNGQRYALNGSATIADWGYANSLNTAAPLYSVLSTMPYEDTGIANQFVVTPDGSTTYLMAGGTLYPIASGSLAQWSIGTATTLTTDDIALLPQGSTINTQLSFGGNNFIADSGRLLVLNSTTQEDYGSTVASGFVSVDSSVGGMFPLYPVSPLVEASGTNSYYMLLNGKQYYVLNSQIMSDWGMNGSLLQMISPSLLSQFPSGGLLTNIVQSTTDSSYYLLDGTSHKIATSLVGDYTTGDPTMQLPTSAITITPGADLDSPIFQINGTPNIYTAMNGQFYYILNNSILDGLGYPAVYGLAHLNGELSYAVSFGGSAQQFMTNGGATYYMQGGTAYPIAAQYVNEWLGSQTALAYPGTDFAQRFTISSTTLTDLVTNGSGTTWLIDNGSAINLGAYATDYTFATPKAVTPFDIPNNSSVSYLARSSTTPSDTRIWLINNGTKQWIENSTEFNAYNSPNIAVTGLSDTTLSAIPTAAQPSDPSILINGGSSGFKLLVNGTFYGFPDGTTIGNVIGSNPVLNVTPEIFNAISKEAGNVSSVMKDASTQQIYFFSNGQKRWITSGQAYSAYSSYPVTTLPHDTMQWFPTGSPIN